jgi:hypothetical protein
LKKGEVKEVSACAVVSGRDGAVLQHGNLFKGRAAILANSQNGDIILSGEKLDMLFMRIVAGYWRKLELKIYFSL